MREQITVIPAHYVPEEVITEKFYTIDELSYQAQQNAYHKWYDRMCHMDCPSDEEYPYVLQDLEKAFDFDVKNYDVGYHYPTFRFVYGCGNVADIDDPIRLRTWVINNWYDIIVPYKQYGGCRHHRTRNSKVLREHNSLPISGIYCEAPFMDVLEAVIDGSKLFNTMDELLEECLDEFFRAWDKDRNYEMSYEYFTEECDNSDVEFDENGEVA